MKTGNNHLAIFALFALLFLAGNVSAKGNGAKASGLENIEETSLEIENWMVDDNVWNTTGKSYFMMADDGTLEIENWMTDELTWEVDNDLLSKTVAEESLAIEQWMFDENIWKR